jgi:hypothetical protein
LYYLNSPDFTRNRGSPDSDKWKRRSSNSPDSARRRRSPDIRRPSNKFPDNTRNRELFDGLLISGDLLLLE